MVDNKDFIEMYVEIIRFVAHAILLHLLSSFDGSETFFNENALKNILFIMLAVIVYHMFVKKVITYLKQKIKETKKNKKL